MSASLGPRPKGDVGAMLAAAAGLSSAAGMLHGARPVSLVRWQSSAAEAARAQIRSHVSALDSAGDDARTASRLLTDAAQELEREQAAWDRAKERADLKDLKALMDRVSDSVRELF